MRESPQMRSLGHLLQEAFWCLQGRHLPLPPRKKHQLLQKYARRFSLSVFVETGTYYGNTLDALKNKFQALDPTELDPQLCQLAQKRFIHHSHVHIVCGDSAQQLPNIIDQVHQPALFWLDAHYSGGVTAQGTSVSPILQELTQIFKQATFRHVILIDDARCFVKDNGFPSLSELYTHLEKYRPSHNLTITQRDDVIRIYPHA